MRRILYGLAIALAAVSCMKYGPMEEENFDMSGSFGDGSTVTGKGLLIACEGNFMYGNASLSYYDPESRHVENEVFARANAQKLGDVAHSMAYHNGVWLVVNSSGVIFAIDPDTFREVGRITGFTSPRCIHFVSDEKAYVTQLWDPRICIVNPKTYAITGYIDTGMDPETASTEQLVQVGKYVYTNCWSYQNRILKIDSERDEIVGELTVGIQPVSLVLDCNGKLWVLTDGGYEGSPYGYEAPSLCRIDPETFTIEQRFRFALGDYPSSLTLNGAGDRLYWINRDVWSMEVTADRVPARPLIEASGTIYYALTVNPVSGEIYVADAIDYVQPGVVLRFSPDGIRTDSFTVGVTPGAFCWR